MNPVSLLEIGRRSRPDTSASISSDTSDTPIDQPSVLSGDDEQPTGTTDPGGLQQLRP